MRVAVVNWNDRRIGGAETYLARLLPALLEQGCELAFWSQVREPLDRDSVVPDGVEAFCAAETGLTDAVRGLRAWGPHLVYAHGFTDPGVEARIQAVGPAIFYAHNYYGTCITGGKTQHRPAVVPCDREFGRACLGQFYPRRCGGRSPLTMLSNYRIQSRRLELLRGYEMVLCASEHMRREYLRHGLVEDRLTLAPYPIRPASLAFAAEGRDELPRDRPWQILFAGRLEPDKGAHVLLDALPEIARRVSHPLRVVFAGDGAERARLAATAERIQAEHPALEVEFAGWVGDDRLELLMADSELLAIPSLWPEPFGMVGLEAARFGVPAVAFAVGGIPGWLQDGRNGTLAPADPPTPGGFAAAAVRALDPARYPLLARGARAEAALYTMDRHLEVLLEVFGSVSGREAALDPVPSAS